MTLFKKVKVSGELGQLQLQFPEWIEHDLGACLQHHATSTMGNFPLKQCGSKRTLVPCVKRNYTVVMSTLRFDWDPKKRLPIKKSTAYRLTKPEPYFLMSGRN